MRYLGGKGRIAKKLAHAILSHTSRRESYWEPFVGGGGMASQMGQHFDIAYYSDIHKDLILMWEAVLMEGWEPPSVVSYEQYQELRYSKEPSAVRGFVGFGGSFGGRWFEGYARGGYNSDGSPRNHMAESSRAVIKGSKTMRARTATHVFQADALTITPTPGAVVYCDPPYGGTKNYSQVDQLDYRRFWETAEEWATLGADVFVSEYSAPSGWTCIWEQSLRSNVRVGSSDRHTAVERLFIPHA